MEILIVGAGAAGLMAAAYIAESDTEAEVCIVEKNAVLGRKVIISGGGRCNVTTADNEMPSLMSSYPRGSRWLRFCMHEVTPSDVYEWFENHGIPLKTEGKKIFPQSNKGTDITEMFQRLFEDKNVDVLLKTSVVKVEKEGDAFKVSFEDGESRYCDKLILTTGGHAYRHTGSTGDGYAFAQSLGHSIKPLAATLTSFSASEPWISDLAGVSIENAKLRLVGREKSEFSGPFLFTHKGVSGPGIFALSSLSAFEECTDEHPLKLFIDFVPSMDYQALSEKIFKKIEQNPKQSLLRILKDFLPKSILTVIFRNLSLDGSKIVSEVAKKDLNRCIEALKNFEMTLNERTPGSEIVTAGGVDLKEVDQKTMESKICPGLFFGGELLDVDGFTGGYNLQIAWATGRLAGLSALGAATQKNA
ncbi:MAG: NAD(P)/FAD-dependent oxidoreductase [bacterium]|nr:NAD(P)/FAD-dependent oxidoreductase [bacterium]